MALTLTPVHNPGRAGRSEQWRPKAPRVTSLQSLARGHTEEAIKTLVVAMRFKGPQQVPAAIAILDRGWGRPAQRIETQSDHLHLHLLAAQLVEAVTIEAQPEPQQQAVIEGSVPTE